MMDMEKKCMVVILPSDKESKIRLNNLGKLSYEPHIQGLYYSGLTHFYQHLYILSDEGIKEGNWYFDMEFNMINILEDKELPMSYDKKIIASTDSSLSIPLVSQ